METIEYDSVIPLYQQIIDAVKKDITTGVYKSGEKLPIESKLSEIYSVSRITIRRAIDELCSQGLVEKKQGKGTFVCTKTIYKSLNTEKISFTELCIANGMKASSKLLSAKVVCPKDHTVLAELGLKPGEQAVEIVRLRYANERPIVIETNVFPMEYAFLLNVNLDHDSLYRYLREEKKVNILPGKLSLRIVRTNAKQSKMLEVPRNTPVLNTFGYALTENGKVLHTIQNVGYGEDFDLVIR